MPVWACFSYSADLPPSVATRQVTQSAPRDLESMPGYPCFAYLGVGPQAVSSPRRMPFTCFSYRAATADIASPGMFLLATEANMPYTCFSYLADAEVGKARI